MRWIPDWLIYLLVIAGIVFTLYRLDAPQRFDAPEALEEKDFTIGGALPPPSIYDPEVLVDVGPVTSGLGSAFAVSPEGWWLTARHVVDDCDKVGVIVSRGAAVEVRETRVAQFADIALLRTDGAPLALILDDAERELQIGQRAYHVGFPQGRKGEATSRLIGRETLITRGRYEFQQPVLAWAETGRTRNLRGSLAGMSGGPALDARGDVIGVTIAESTRRGRIYTAAPSTIARLLRLEQVAPDGQPGPRLTVDNYGEQADDLRRKLAVAQVVCIAGQGPSL
jgi:S1-C subfamily serine protease